MVKKLQSPATEKSTFAQTCNLLSQYLKAGKAGLGDISLTAAKLELHPSFTHKSSAPAPTTTTLDLLPGIGSSASNRESSESVELLPRFAGYGSTPAAGGGGGGGGSQMTIFYGGKVVVFNDFPAEKAKEIMALVSEQQGINNNNNNNNNSHDEQAAPAAYSSSCGHLRPPQLPHRPMGSDLPIARRASLHRFLEKRKDRVTSRGPYHHHNQMQSPETAADGNNSSKNPWMDRQQMISQSAQQLELRL